MFYKWQCLGNFISINTAEVYFVSEVTVLGVPYVHVLQSTTI